MQRHPPGPRGLTGGRRRSPANPPHELALPRPGRARRPDRCRAGRQVGAPSARPAPGWLRAAPWAVPGRRARRKAVVGRWSCWKVVVRRSWCWRAGRRAAGRSPGWSPSMQRWACSRTCFPEAPWLRKRFRLPILPSISQTRRAIPRDPPERQARALPTPHQHRRNPSGQRPPSAEQFEVFYMFNRRREIAARTDRA